MPKSKSTITNVTDTPSPRRWRQKWRLTANLQEKLEKQEDLIAKLREDAAKKDTAINLLETKVLKMEGLMALNSSLHFVRERVVHELQKQVTNLQQYTRRYSIVIAGVKSDANENEDQWKRF